MSERMTTEDLRALLSLLRSPEAHGHTRAPVFRHEAVSVLDEVLELRAEVERLRAAALRAIEVAFRGGNQYGHEATAEGWWCSEPDFGGAEDYLADALAEVSDG